MEDNSWCPDCHALRSTPACDDQSNQSWETEELEGIKLSLKQDFESVEKACQVVEFDQKIRAIVKTIHHPWLRGMLDINDDGYSSLGDAVLDRVRNVHRLVDEVLAKCKSGIPTNSLRIDFYAAVDQYDEASNLVDHLHEIIRLLHDLGKGDSYYNEICKQAEMCKLLLQGPQEAPYHLEYLHPGFMTPNAFKLKPDSGAVCNRHSPKNQAVSKDCYVSALINLLKQKDVLPFRRAFYHAPSRDTNEKRTTLPVLNLGAISSKD